MRKRKGRIQKEVEAREVPSAAAEQNVLFRRYLLCVFFSVVTILLILSLCWFLEKGAPHQQELPFRIVAGGIMVFLVPGLIWGEVLSFRAAHCMEVMAYSFLISLIVEMALLPIPFICRAPIQLWVILLFALLFSGLFIVSYKVYKKKPLSFLEPLITLFEKPFAEYVSSLCFIVILAVIACGAYRWGEDLSSIDGEKWEHILFIRNYFSLPLLLQNLGIDSVNPVPNIVNLWEYLLAAWARIIHCDPLPLFFRARFIIPLAGIPSMFLLIRSVVDDVKKSEILFWGVLFMVAGWLPLLSPSILDGIKSEQFRGVFAFMGTSHHADSAMDMLIAPGAALIFLCIRRPSWRELLLLSGVMVAGFLWHPREFFQNALYGGVAGVALLLFPSETKKSDLKNWLVTIAAILAVGVFCILLMKVVVPLHQSGGYDEMMLKRISLGYALSHEHLFTFRNLFHFPYYFTLSSIFAPDQIKTSAEVYQIFGREWQFMLWLFLTALFLPVTALRGSQEERRFSLFTALLWFLCFCWNFSMLLMIVFTYSEILIGVPRLIYIFSYVLIADGLFIAAQIMITRRMSSYTAALYPVSMLLTGALIGFIWKGSQGMDLYPLTVLFTLTGVCTLVFLVVPHPVKDRLSIAGKPRFFITVLGMLLFFIPILGKDYSTNISSFLTGRRASLEWYGSANPLGYSQELIQYIRKLPPRRNFLVDPLGNDCIFVYAPQVTVVMPRIITTIVKDMPVYQEVTEGRHPLFNPGTHNGSAGAIDERRLKEWLTAHNVEYILFRAAYYDALVSFFSRKGSPCEIVFQNPQAREAVVRFHRE
ncbi:MAG: hypothetical protein AB9903_29305 [Vulcanimicrobiota bacterium]